MNPLSDIIHTLHTVLLILFIGTTALLMLATIINRLRIRRIVFTWSAGRFFGLPLCPSIFMLVVLPTFIYGLITDSYPPYLHPLLLVGYLAGGIFWYVAALISNSIVVTDYGIIQNVNRIGKAVAWGQIIDYIHEDTSPGRYVFFYIGKRREKRRLEVVIPRSYRGRFEEIIEAKLDARFNFSVEQAYGRTTMKR